jgi:hypothetical protein
VATSLPGGNGKMVFDARGRALVTGSEFDVQFDDLSATYFFGVAAFDNAQVRHAFHRGAIAYGFGE